MAGSSSSVAPTSVRKVSKDMLYVSEPNPMYFGNPVNAQNDPHWTNKNWLKSRFHFSFAEYTNRNNLGFGVLRVMNDDLVQPARGFGAHPHRDMEICTFIVDGQLTHQDSMGTAESLGPNSIQFMTAGTGVVHSESNEDKTNPLRFIQIWIVPRRRGLEPKYGSMRGDGCDWQLNQWNHLVSDVENTQVKTPVKINQDANLSVVELSPGSEVPLTIEPGRQAYFLQVKGASELESSSTRLVQHEAAELKGPMTLAVRNTDAEINALCLVIEMNNDGRGGRF